MRSETDAGAAAILRAIVENIRDTRDDTLAHARGTPEAWRRWSMARKLWYLRKRAKLSQAGLARRCKTTQSHIARLERGLDARLGTLRAVFRGLGYELLVLPYPLADADKEVFGTEERRGLAKPEPPAAS